MYSECHIEKEKALIEKIRALTTNMPPILNPLVLMLAIEL